MALSTLLGAVVGVNKSTFLGMGVYSPTEEALTSCGGLMTSLSLLTSLLGDVCDGSL